MLVPVTVTINPTVPTEAPSDDGSDDLRRRELGGFLRSRRERIAPEQVGFPVGGRRRTPGLRREEVAQLAGVGVTWYTWLEQGREINASEQVLEAIGRVLMLDVHERTHLFTLAGAPVPNFTAECQGLPTEVPTLLGKLHPFPASVSNGRFDLLAYNDAYQALIGDVDALPLDQRNGLWLMFTSATHRSAVLDWDEAARRMVGQYRANMADHVAEPTWKCLVRRLTEASPEFARLWSEHEVLAPENLVKRILHPDLGVLQLKYTNLWLSQRLAVKMVTYTPADDATRLALERIDSVTPRRLL
jgi:transcriptional regulator with XRE-family HTH domain